MLTPLQIIWQKFFINRELEMIWTTILNSPLKIASNFADTKRIPSNLLLLLLLIWYLRAHMLRVEKYTSAEIFIKIIINLPEQEHKRAPSVKNHYTFHHLLFHSNFLFRIVSADQVTNFLRSHPDFLERFVMEEVELEQLERWIIRRSQRLKKKPEASSKNSRKTSLSRWKFCVHADKRQMLQDLTYSLQLKPTKDHVLWELATCISSAVGADGFRWVSIWNVLLSLLDIIRNTKTRYGYWLNFYYPKPVSAI